MKNYKDFEKKCIGESDCAFLTLVGCGENDIALHALKFGGDDAYFAYIVNEPAEIGAHYEKIATFRAWLKIYDDNGLTAEFRGKSINVYRAGNSGCVIEIVEPR